MNNAPTVFPTMRYHDAPAAIKWLCEVLGFEEKLVVPGDGGSIAHAQLTLGNGLIMISSARAAEFDQHVKPPVDFGGIGTQSVCVFVEDLQTHYDTAIAKGAEIAIPFATEETRSGYGVKDIEGHLWFIGDYNPWADA